VKERMRRGRRGILERRWSTIAPGTIDRVQMQRHPAAVCLSGVQLRETRGTLSTHLVSVPGMTLEIDSCKDRLRVESCNWRTWARTSCGEFQC
jgi:hypothetical protein